MEKPNTNLILVSIVAVVAIVGIIVMITSASTSNLQYTDSSGQAAKALKVTDSTSTEAIAVATCIDSDGGVNYYVKGTTTAGKTSKTDFCRNYNSSTLVEYYCNRNKVAAMPDYTCPNGCINGACKNQTIITCTDSDGGLNYYVSGYTFWLNHGSYYDDCINATIVTEYYCTAQGTGASVNFNCPYGCFEGTGVGRCLSSSELNNYTCTDSDGGINYGVKGTVYGLPSFNWADFCSTDGSQLTEFYCSGRIPQQISKTCTCSNGACNNQTNTTGNLYVGSNPTGASIYVDNIFWGTTIRIISGLSVGNHVVNINKQGYVNYTTTKYVYAGQTAVVNITLKPLKISR